MAELHIVTASYLPDVELFEELHRSVLQFTRADVTHEVVVPRGDAARFRAIDSDRLLVTVADELFPRSFVRIDAVTRAIARLSGLKSVGKIQAVNLRAPWPPVRGWILQQVIKLAAAQRSRADVVLIVDSDVCLIRPLDVTDLLQGDTVRFYRAPGGVTLDMEQHQSWHDVSRDLLGLAPTPRTDRSDYIAGFVTWDPAVVRGLLDRVARHRRTSWQNAVCSELAFSECTLYGTYVDQVIHGPADEFASSDVLCAIHWDPTTLDDRGGDALLTRVKPSDLAVQIQSTSDTPIELRRRIAMSARAKTHRDGVPSESAE